MPDDRPLRVKLEAMANQTASPEEAAIARAMLENPAGTHARIESRRVLTRATILAAPNRTAGPRREVEVRFPSGRWVQMYEDEVNWPVVVRYGLSTRTVRP